MPSATRLANKTWSPIGAECGSPGTGAAAVLGTGLDDTFDEIGIDDVTESVVAGVC